MDIVHQKSERCAWIVFCVYVLDVLRWARTQLSWQKVSFATFSKWLKGWEGCGSKIKTGHQIFFSIRATLEDENLNFLKWIKTSFDDIRRFFHFLPLYPGDRLLRIFTQSNRIVLISILTWPLSSKMTNIVIESFPIVMWRFFRRGPSPASFWLYYCKAFYQLKYSDQTVMFVSSWLGLSSHSG